MALQNLFALYRLALALGVRLELEPIRPQATTAKVDHHFFKFFFVFSDLLQRHERFKIAPFRAVAGLGFLLEFCLGIKKLEQSIASRKQIARVGDGFLNDGKRRVGNGEFREHGSVLLDHGLPSGEEGCCVKGVAVSLCRQL